MLTEEQKAELRSIGDACMSQDGRADLEDFLDTLVTPEPAFMVVNHERDSDNWPCNAHVKSLGDHDLDHVADGTLLYTAPVIDASEWKGYAQLLTDANVAKKTMHELGIPFTKFNVMFEVLVKQYIAFSEGKSAHTTRYQQDYKAQRDELISIMKQIKSNLMHHRRFGDDTFRAWKNAAARAEGDLEEALDSLKGYE